MIDGELKSRQTASDPIHPIHLAAQIQKYIGDDAYYVVDGGDTSYFGLVGFMSKHKAALLVHLRVFSVASAPAFRLPWRPSWLTRI